VASATGTALAKARKAASMAEQRPLRTARAKTTVGRDQRR
jgi:hypothetical protein